MTNLINLSSYEQKVKPLFEMAAGFMGFHDYVFSPTDATLLAEKRRNSKNDHLSEYEIARSIIEEQKSKRLR